MAVSGPVFIAAIVFPIIATIVLLCALYCCLNSRKPPESILQSGPHRREYEKWVKKLEPEISLRLGQERDTSRGNKIIIIEDVKYELRQNHETGEFFVNVAQCMLDHERRQAALAKTFFPEYDGHHVCLIGWMNLSRDRIEGIARQVGTGWDYNRFTNNCQHYLKLFADEILVEEKGADYPWFQENTRTEYLNSRAPPPPPEAVAAMHQVQQTVIQINLQFNMQWMNQAIMLNVQSMNPVMNPAMNPGMNSATFC